MFEDEEQRWLVIAVVTRCFWRKGGRTMKLTYDPRYNIASLRLKEKIAQVKTICVGYALNLDMAPDGTIYGIELLNANEQVLSHLTAAGMRGIIN